MVCWEAGIESTGPSCKQGTAENQNNGVYYTIYTIYYLYYIQWLNTIYTIYTIYTELSTLYTMALMQAGHS